MVELTLYPHLLWKGGGIVSTYEAQRRGPDQTSCGPIFSCGPITSRGPQSAVIKLNTKKLRLVVVLAPTFVLGLSKNYPLTRIYKPTLKSPCI